MIGDSQNAIYRVAQLLAHMHLLSSAPTSRSLDASPQIAPGKPGSRPPRSGGKSLLEEYEMELNLLAMRMERDIARFTHRSPKSGREDKQEREERISVTYAGWPAIKVAVWEGVSQKTIERIRIDAGVDPQTGSVRRER